MKSALFASVAALALCGAAGPASATTYDFSYQTASIQTGNPITAAGSFDLAPGDSSVRQPSGSINGSSITGLDGSSVNAFLGGFLDISFDTASGVTYTFVGAAFNAEAYSTAGDFDFGPFKATAVSAVPLPASLPMFGAALLGLGAVGYGLKRNSRNAAAA